MIRKIVNRLTGTVARERFGSPCWINVVYNENSKYDGMQSSIKAAGYKLTEDNLRVTKAIEKMNESPYKSWDLENVEKAWIGNLRYEPTMLVEPNGDRQVPTEDTAE